MVYFLFHARSCSDHAVISSVVFDRSPGCLISPSNVVDVLLK